MVILAMATTSDAPSGVKSKQSKWQLLQAGKLGVHHSKQCDDSSMYFFDLAIGYFICTYQLLQSDAFEVVKWPFLGLNDLELVVEKVILKNHVF